MYRHQIFVLAAALVFTINSASAQDKPDGRLLSKFSQVEIEAMNSETLVYWNYVVSKGYRIAQNFKTDSDMKEIELGDWDSPTFNILAHGLAPMETHVQTFIIKGTDRYIQILSEKKIKALIK